MLNDSSWTPMNKIIVSRLCEAVSRTEQVGPSRVQAREPFEEIISLSSVKYRRHIWNGGQLMDAPLDVAIAAQTDVPCSKKGFGGRPSTRTFTLVGW